ncbi:hypothetical protein HK102_000482 [Quaeritorhiza haematococci]|nr:hypothetical protein HK102_000482 [Quaeritorhiza haematococci]
MTGAVGRGTINCELDPANPDKCILSRFSYNYPLRFLVPKSYSKRAISVYGLSFGGGLVSGDQIQISLDVASNCCLTFLTQASTKVFKQRTPFGIKYLSKSETDGLGRVDERLDDATAAKQQDQHRPPDGSRQKKRNAVEDVTQVLDVGIGEGALLALLPEPVTCFAQASYGQTQTFRVAATGSLVLLDWFTSGRMSRGESWLFKRYRSENIVIVEGIGVVVKDAWVLEDERGKAGGHKQKTACRGEPTSVDSDRPRCFEFEL